MEISAFLDRKLARRFQTFDTDGNGYIEQQDFALSASRMGDAFGHGPESAARQRLYDLSLQLWFHLLKVADTDGDRRISLAEYKVAFSAGLLETPASFDDAYLPFLKAIMDIADTDGDGKLTEDDYVRWTGGLMNLSEADAREVFRRLDQDGDGRVTSGDVLEAIRAYYFDEDPQSAGSWLLGPLERA